jgi:tetratricopeptide (TPR) repeat protein
MKDHKHQRKLTRIAETLCGGTFSALVFTAVLLLAARPAAAQAEIPGVSGKATPLQLLQAAHTSFAQKDYDSARRYYLRVLPSYPQNLDVVQNLAYCYFVMGRAGYAQAARYYAKAYELEPGSTDIADKLSTCYLALRRPSEAAAILQKLAERPGSPPEAWKRSAEAFARANKPAEAESAYDAYLQRRPGDLAARTQLGILYGQQKDYTQAMEQFRLALSSNPNYSAALIGTGRILSWQGQYEDSLAQYERVLRLNPSNGEALSGKAFVLLWMGKPTEAEPIFSKLHRRYPKDDEVARGLEAAQASVEQKNLAQARRTGNVALVEALYRERLNKNPQDIEALKILISLTANPNRCAESIGFARRALEISPDDLSIELTLARSLTICQQYAEAIARYKRYIDARPKAEDALFEMAQLLFRTRRIPEATQAYRDLLQVNPNNQDASQGLAQCLASSGNYQEALVRYDEVLKTAPNNYDALQGKAYILYWTEQFAQARAIFENLAAQRPSDPQNAKALEDIANAVEAARWAELRPAPGSPPKDFVVYYQKRLASYPDDVSAMKGLAYSQSQVNNMPAAIEGYERVLDKNPDDLDAQKELARLLGQDAQYDKSIQIYKSIVKNHPDDKTSTESLARVYLWANRPAEALPLYQDLLAQDPQNTGLKMQVARLELQLKNYPAAHETLASVVTAEPNNREARLALAQLEFNQGQREESLKNYDRLLEVDPKDPDALLGKAQISYYDGNMPMAQSTAESAVNQRPESFDAVFLLANVEHARGHRGKTKEMLKRAEQISPGNPEVLAMKERVRQESAVTLHTGATYAREIGPSNEVTLGGIGFLPEASVGGLPNEDIRFQTYGATLGVPLFPKVDSYFSFTSFPTQSPTPSIRGAVAPWAFVSRHVWRPSHYLTIRGGAGMSRFGPPEVERSPRTTGDLSNLRDRYGPVIFNVFGITDQQLTTFTSKPVGMAGVTITPHKKFSIDLDWFHSPAVAYPTPFAMRYRLTQTRFNAGLNFLFTPRTQMHLDFFYTRLYSDDDVQSYRLNNAQLSVISLAESCASATPFEISQSPTTRTCLGGQLVGEVGAVHDWGHGGALTFDHTFLQSERFSLDGGYRNSIYGFAGRKREVFQGFFNPPHYQNHQLTGRIYGKLFGPVGYDFFGALGVQQTNTITDLGPETGAFKRSGTIRPSFSFKVSPHLTLGIAYTHYNSAQVLGPLRGNSVSLTTDWRFY